MLIQKIVKKLYTGLFYFELGRGTAARFYGWIPELIIIVGGLKYLMGWNLTNVDVIIIFLVIALLMFIGGYVIKKTGLYDIDRRVQASKDPVMSELLQAARIKK